jgi:hypothetical protein
MSTTASPVASIGSSIIQAVTGVDPNQISNQLSSAEVLIEQIVEVIVVLLAIIAVELAFVVRNTRK